MEMSPSLGLAFRGKFIRSTIHLKLKMVVQIRKGCAGQCEDTVKLYENVFYPSPSPSLANGVSFIDHANTIHCVAHDGFSLELKVSECGKAEIKDCTVCTVCLQAKGGKLYVDNGADMAARRL